MNTDEYRQNSIAFVLPSAVEICLRLVVKTIAGSCDVRQKVINRQLSRNSEHHILAFALAFQLLPIPHLTQRLSTE